ncbi:hypothetical protein HNO53_20640 [Billgrantia antri]|uniref:DnaT DNA-binding domain-containing protein n=1 Tax=Halomonas sulfidivorans TaxID=2733488 RepID=A0ABX7WKG7_9GAMM|nr:hypothetical protein HNO53_20640 [Halomonas sulfidivorans]
MSSISASMLPALLGRPVAYQPVFTRLPGVTVQGAIFLSQALFLCNTPTAQRRAGWFWKEQAGAVDSWEAETGMSAKQQVTARRQLVAIGVLEEVRKGVPAKTWYRVNCDRLAELLAQALDTSETAAEPRRSPDSPNGRNCNLPTGETRNAQPECTESPDGSFHTETTTEITPSLSEARASIFERAAQQCDDGTPPPTQSRQYPMTLDWQPDPDQLAMACQRAGLPADTQPAQHQLAKFTAHHADTQRQQSSTAWHAKLVDWLRNDQRAAQAHTGGPAHDRADPDQRRDDRTEREAVRQQLANPHDTSWADGWWPDDGSEPGAQAADHVTGQSGVHPAGGDFSEDLEQRVPQCGPADPGTPRAGAGAGTVAGFADSARGRAGHERAEAWGEYLAADDPGAGEPAGAETGGLRYAVSW